LRPALFSSKQYLIEFRRNMIGDYISLLRAGLSELKKEGIGRLSVQESTLEALRSALPAAKPLIPEKSTQSKILETQRENKQAQQAEPQNESQQKNEFQISNLKSQIKNESPAPPAASSPSLPPPPTFTLPPGDKPTRLAALRELVLADPTCNANKHPGKQLVFGVGSPDASLFFCGEAPGADEETVGEPFVGPAGQLLTKIIEATGLKREQVYIANIMKWRPDTGRAFGNRPPTADEMAYCLPFLRAQLEIIQPKVIIALGNTAVDGLLGINPQRTMSSIRGKWQDFNGTPLIPTFHPSYLLRLGGATGASPAAKSAKRAVWEAMLAAMERVELPISERQRSFFL
jgi:DNA polymerase